MKIRVATWNVHQFVGADGERNEARIIEVIRSLDADVVALQEVPLGSEEAVPPALLHVKDLHGVAAAHQRRDGFWLGNVVLSRFPVERQARIDLAFGTHEPRSALDVTLRTNARPLRVIATHLGLRPAERRYQVRKIVSSVAHDERSVSVLTGDFNEWFLVGRPLRWLHKHFGKSPALRTFPARYPVFALDRVWVHPPAAMISLQRRTGKLISIASDHLPVVAEIDVSVRG